MYPTVIDKVKDEVRFLQEKMMTIVMLHEWNDSLDKFTDLIVFYRPLDVIRVLIQQRTVLETALLIDINGKLNLLTPINNYVNNSGEDKIKRKGARVILDELKGLFETPKATKVKEIRDWYLAHSDLHSRENREINLNKLQEFNQSLIEAFNKFTEIIEVPRVNPTPISHNSISNLLSDLRKFQISEAGKNRS